MKLRLLKGSKREPREPLREVGTSKININQSMVPLVPLVPSILPRACEGAKYEHIPKISSKSPPLCKNEGTEGTEGTGALLISFLWFPLSNKEGTLREPRGTFGEHSRDIFSHLGGQLMSKAFSPELGLYKEELRERVISQGLVRKVNKKIGGQVYEVLAIDSKVMGGLRK